MVESIQVLQTLFPKVTPNFRTFTKFGSESLHSFATETVRVNSLLGSTLCGGTRSSRIWAREHLIEATLGPKCIL